MKRLVGFLASVGHKKARRLGKGSGLVLLGDDGEVFELITEDGGGVGSHPVIEGGGVDLAEVDLVFKVALV